MLDIDAMTDDELEAAVKERLDAMLPADMIHLNFQRRGDADIAEEFREELAYDWERTAELLGLKPTEIR